MARCLGLPREVMWMVCNKLQTHHIYVLVCACSQIRNLYTHPNVSHYVILHNCANEYAAAGRLQGLEWLYSLGTSFGIPGNYAISRDNEIMIKWLCDRRWIIATDGWILHAWFAGAVKCAEFLRDRLMSLGLNTRLKEIDFTKPYDKNFKLKDGMSYVG